MVSFPLKMLMGFIVASLIALLKKLSSVIIYFLEIKACVPLLKCLERLAKTSAEASKTYQEYNWNAIFKDGSLSKQTIAVIDKYLKHHGPRSASNKHAEK